MRSELPDRGRIFVETEVFRRVKHAVQVGETPALVLGAPGSGKTSLLLALADEWASSGKKAVVIPLRQAGRDEDL